jgi:hypothetical protein
MRFSIVMTRVAPVVLAMGFVVFPAAALAHKAPAPVPSPSATVVAAADDRTYDGGVITGRVTHVDYSSGVISVDSPTQGRLDVTTMPTTSVTANDPGYHSLTDVAKGSKVQIFISRTAGKLVAQIIRLIKH